MRRTKKNKFLVFVFNDEKQHKKGYISWKKSKWGGCSISSADKTCNEKMKCYIKISVNIITRNIGRVWNEERKKRNY